VPHPKERAIRDRAYATWERATYFWSKFLKADHKTAKNVLTRVHVPPNAPFTVSDAIENELYRLEAGRGVKRVATRTARFIARPESMTAYATLAAAVAAIFSVKAAFLAVESAERQEKAVFTNTLFSKQVDALATVLATAEKNGNAPSPDGSLTMLDVLENDIHSIMILYPEDAQPFLLELGKHLVDMKRDIRLSSGAQDDASISGSSAEDELKTVKKLQEYEHLIYALETCSAAQLRQGKYIDGPTFQSCTGELLKAHEPRGIKSE
jgi:hypothetical protein